MSNVAVVKKELVRISNGILNGKVVTGVFELIDYKNEGYGVEVLVQLANNTQDWIKIKGGTSKVEPVEIGTAISADMPAVQIGGINARLTEEQVEAIICERFEVMDTLVKSLEISDIKSVVITGAAGIGKTFNIEQYLEQREAEVGQHWGSIGGSCSGFGLYEALYEFRNEGSVLVMDDVDVFDDEVKINLLKNALDTKKHRTLDWRGASKALVERDIPNTFEFKGKVIFLTNTNIYAEINGNTKRAPHLNALVSRSVTLDLGIHDVKTILIHVRSVMRRSDMLVKRGLTPFQQEQVINWLEKNRENLAALSLRTPLMVGEYIKTSPDHWEAMCRHTLLKAVALNY